MYTEMMEMFTRTRADEVAITNAAISRFKTN